MRRVGRAARRLAWPALFAAVLVAVVMLGIIPTRTYLQKRDDVASAEARLQQLNEGNDKAQRHVDALKTDAEIEKIAREQYGLVKPGEEAYHVLPPPQDPVEIPDVWPFNRFHTTLGK
jgi:cell division protein FtsB